MNKIFKILIILKNASIANKSSAFIIYNRRYLKVLKKLTIENLILGYKILRNLKKIIVFLRFLNFGGSPFNKLQIIGHNRLPIVFSSKSLYKLLGGSGLYLIFTTKGILTHHECIRFNLGGVCFCHIL